MSLSEELYGIPESDPNLYASRDIDAIARRWNSKAEKWDFDLKNELCHLNDGDAYGHFIELGRQLVLDRQEICLMGSLVDLGCGTGCVLAELSKHFYKSIGIDISREMLNIAASKNIRNAEWLLDDVFEMSWCRRKHAAVFSRGILLSHYGDELAKLLIKQTIQSLAPGGFALFDFLSSDAPEATRLLAPHKRYFCPDWLIDQAKSMGSSGAVVAGNPIARVRYLILKD
jgi:predicted TPR repeat methyltransferase